MATPITRTLLNLVQTVSCFTESDEEVTTTVAYLVNSGKVRLCRNFAGAKIDLSPLPSVMSGHGRPGLSGYPTALPASSLVLGIC